MADIVQLKENGVAKYLKTHVNAVEDLDTKLAGYEPKNTLSSGEVLWTGAVYPHGAQVVTPSKTLSQCKTGWVLQYCPYGSSGALGYMWESIYVLKAFRGIMASGLGNGENGNFASKRVEIKETEIRGSSFNDSVGNNKTMVLARIMSF